MHPVHGKRKRRRKPLPEAPSRYEDGSAERRRIEALGAAEQPQVRPPRSPLGWDASTVEKPDPTLEDEAGPTLEDEPDPTRGES